MLKKYRNIALLAIVFIYAIQLLPYFSDTIYEKVRTYRYERQLTKFNLREVKYIPLESWTSIKNKKEFKIDGVFYDIYSHSFIDEDTVKLIAFKDSHENRLHLFFNHFLKKGQSNSKEKKKPIQTKLPYISLEQEITLNYIFSCENYPTKNFWSQEGKAVNIVNSILKPPTV